MPINADKPHLWKADTRASVDQFNQWFMKFAPKAYRETRKKTVESVEQGSCMTKDLTADYAGCHQGEPRHTADAAHVHLSAAGPRPADWPGRFQQEFCRHARRGQTTARISRPTCWTST